MTGIHAINTPKITISAGSALLIQTPQETHAALTIGRNSASLQIFSSPVCSCRLFHFTLLNIKPSKHFHLSVPYCQSNYRFITVSNHITYFPGEFQTPIARSNIDVPKLLGVGTPQFYFQAPASADRLQSIQVQVFPFQVNRTGMLLRPHSFPPTDLKSIDFENSKF